MFADWLILDLELHSNVVEVRTSLCLCGHVLKIFGINRKSRVLYPGPGFLSSATWSSLPKGTIMD